MHHQPTTRALVAVLAGVFVLAMGGRPGGPSVASAQTAGKERRAMTAGEGIISKASTRPVPETLERLEAVLRGKGITVFARIDHSGEAAKVGLTMPPTQLLIFGSPKAGTPVMLAAPTAAIDLPLKALAWQDAEGRVWLSYTDPAYLARRFGLSEAQVAPIAGVGTLIELALK